MRKLPAQRWRQRRLGTALTALSMTLALAPASFAAPVPATAASGQSPAGGCPKASPADAQPQRKAEASGGSGVAALIAAGIGTAGLTTGIVYQLLAHSKNSEAARLCHTGGSGICADVDERQRHQRLVSAASGDRQIGFIALGAGSAALVTAAVLLLTGRSDPPPDDAPELSVGLSEGQWGATLSGRF